MPQSSNLKRSLAVLGLSLGAAFNLQAAAPADAPIAPIPVVSSTMTVGELNQKLTEALNDVSVFLAAKESDPGFDPVTSIGLKSRIDNIKAIVNNGANPNNYGEGTLTFAGKDDLNPIGAAILIAAKAQRPDLVQAFIDRGVDLRLRTRRGWGPMDYIVALIRDTQDGGQVVSTSKADIAGMVAILKILHNAGLRVEDATALTKGSTLNTKNYASAVIRHRSDDRFPVNGLVLLSQLNKQGLMSDAEFNKELTGDRKNATQLLDAEGISDELIQQNGGILLSIEGDIFPGTSKLVRIKTSATLLETATIYKDIIGARNVEDALAQIGELNDIKITPDMAARPPEKDLVIELPISPKNQIGFITVRDGESLRDIAKQVQSTFYKKNLSIEGIAADIASMNALDIKKIDDQSYLAKGRALTFGVANDNYTHVQPTTPPPGADPQRKIDLFVVETPKDINESSDKTDEISPKTDHALGTFRVAVNTGYGINRDVDMNRFHALNDSIPFFPNKTSNLLRILLNAGDAPIGNRIMFSVSDGQTPLTEEDGNALKRFLPSDNVTYEGTRLMLNFLEKSRPIIFAAAGNSRLEEGAFMASHIGTHSPRSITVGSVGRYLAAGSGPNKARVMSPYTSYFADICTALPMHAGNQEEGSSFATPETAAFARQYYEWYGNRLSFEEIMAAAFMSADRDFQDYANPAMAFAHLAKRKTLEDSDLITRPVPYTTNGGGLPHSIYCGPGVINPEKWKKNLDTLVSLKRAGQDATGKSFIISAGKPVVTNSGGAVDQKQYIYRLAVPQDMTLGHLTFLLPQNLDQRGDIAVKMPSGFELLMPGSLNDIVSTQAFAYEDVRAGSSIEIRTTRPLGDTAGIILRGQAPGNAIALLRDRLRSEGALPEPLKTMEGNAVTGPSKPVTILRDAPKPN